MIRPLVDDPAFAYTYLYGLPARCHVRCYGLAAGDLAAGDVVLIATDLGAENPGAAAGGTARATVEAIATAVCRRYGFDPLRLTVVVHMGRPVVPAAPLGEVLPERETFEIVTFRRRPRLQRALAGAVARTAEEDDAARMQGGGGSTFAGPCHHEIPKRRVEEMIGRRGRGFP